MFEAPDDLEALADNLGPGDLPDPIAALLNLARRILKDGLEPHRETLEAAADDVAVLYESDDPLANGWVDCRGCP
jgi:hypothetical protein